MFGAHKNTKSNCIFPNGISIQVACRVRACLAHIRSRGLLPRLALVVLFYCIQSYQMALHMNSKRGAVNQASLHSLRIWIIYNRLIRARKRSGVPPRAWRSFTNAEDLYKRKRPPQTHWSLHNTARILNYWFNKCSADMFPAKATQEQYLRKRNTADMESWKLYVISVT